MAIDVDSRKRDMLDIRRRIQLGANGTYIGEILGERDSALARWPDRMATPVRVWVGNNPTIPGWDPSIPRARPQCLRPVGRARHSGEVHFRSRLVNARTST